MSSGERAVEAGGFSRTNAVSAWFLARQHPCKALAPNQQHVCPRLSKSILTLYYRLDGPLVALNFGGVQ